jgi:hypothetical protein
MKTMRMMTVLCLLGAALAWGCGNGGKVIQVEKDKGGHEHDKPGPHKGMVEDFGKDEKYHVEVVFDRDKKQATVYVLDENEEKNKPSKCDKLTLTLKEPKLTVALKPDPMPGEKDGLCSRFVGTDEKLADKGPFSLDKVVGAIDGKERVADYEGRKEEPPKK